MKSYFSSDQNKKEIFGNASMIGQSENENSCHLSLNETIAKLSGLENLLNELPAEADLTFTLKKGKVNFTL